MCGVEMFLAIVLHSGPWVLVVMGAAVALKPPPPTDRFVLRLWIAAFAVVVLIISAAGGAAWYLDRQEQIKADAEFKKFKEELTGGDNSAFVRARQETKEDGKNWIVIETTGALPSLLVGFHPLSPDGTPVGEKNGCTSVICRKPRLTPAWCWPRTATESSSRWGTKAGANTLISNVRKRV